MRGLRVVDYEQVIQTVIRATEVLGVAVFVVGGVWAAVRGVLDLASGKGGRQAYDNVRKYLGRSILLGLEILVAADLIRTVAVEPTLENVLVLGAIVAIRTFLSFSLEIELEGELPWRRAQARS